MALPVRRIDPVVFRVRDLARVRAFWIDVLGAQEERVQAEIGLHHLRLGDFLIDLVPVDGPLGRAGGAPPDPAAANVDHLCLLVDPWDGDAVLAHLAAHGIAAHITSRYGAAGQGPSVYLADPEGNRLELRGPAAEAA